ncbi:YciI family protein [Allokutzneria sp. NRRL B-24872]|uniref:YciI family protein n=1 Tax=Allokutzneria sp. NRRL B-24872 TaxID=1137961 RepID=UPI000A37FBB5|nr:YciI family protein [Allokutzneria sp. NRRL B-24872]
MKYMILAYGSQQDYDSMAADSTEDLAAIGEFLAAFTGELADSGELVDTQGLAAPVLARRVRLRDGAAVVTDGPFAETEEVIAGYWIVDCASFDRATEIAVRLNQAPGRAADAGVVIRPLMGAEHDTDDV